MKNIFNIAVVALIGFSASSFAQDKGLELQHMDTSVRPQDDFYNYVNGSWMKTAQIPSDKSTWGSFNKLAEDTDNNSLSILNSLLKENLQKEQKAKNSRFICYVHEYEKA
jgi:putative endopeptidase